MYDIGVAITGTGFMERAHTNAGAIRLENLLCN